MRAHNSTGRPLASPAWLEAHHRAKRQERLRFAETLAECRPARVVDLGCATGLWLDTLDQVLPPSCEFIGLDSDESSLAQAQKRSAGWGRKASFSLCDIEMELDAIPQADLTLVFNVFPYLRNPAALLEYLGRRHGSGAVAVRQYDGAALRFGPMETESRSQIESSLRASILASQQFRHYDLDRVFGLLYDSPFENRRIRFELFSRSSPFPPEFVDYFEGTITWTLDLLSEDAAGQLRAWHEQTSHEPDRPLYFFEVDLTAVLS